MMQQLPPVTLDDVRNARNIAAEQRAKGQGATASFLDAIASRLESTLEAETRSPSDEIVSMAGRILAGGNPLENEQIRLVIVREIEEAIRAEGEQIPAIGEKRLFDGLTAALGVYFENMLSLAGSVLSVEHDSTN